jgi:hypothetical protein
LVQPAVAPAQFALATAQSHAHFAAAPSNTVVTEVE